MWSPDDGCPMLFKMESLPFGATAAVAAFLRISRAIKCLGTSLGKLAWTAFYDDFICISKAEGVESTDMFIRFLFRSLGWELSSGPDKDASFGLTPAESLSMRLRLLFAESQIFGRHARTALRVIGSVALFGRAQRPLSSQLVHCLSWMRERVLLSKPRRIDTAMRKTMLIFLMVPALP